MTLRIHAPNPMRVGETGNVLVTSDNPGVVSLVYGAGLTGPATVEIGAGITRTWRTSNYRYLEATKGNATINAATAGRDQVSICTAYDLKNAEAMMRRSKEFYSPTLAMSMKAGIENRTNWALWLYHFNENQSYFFYRQSVDNSTNSVDYYSAAIGNGGIFIGRNRIKIVWIFDRTSVIVYWKYLNTAIAEDTRTIARPLPVGTMGDDVLAMIGCEDFAYYNRKLDASERASYYAGTFPSDPICAYPMNEETGVKHYDLYGTNDTELGIDQTYAFPYFSADNRNTGPSRIYFDSASFVPYAIVPVTATATTGTTIDATRPRQGVPARASAAEKTETADQCVVTVNDPVGAVGPVINARVKL